MIRPLKSGRLVCLAAVAALVFGCDFGATGDAGCVRVTQGSYTFPDKRILAGSFAARLTRSGIDFMTERVKALVLTFFNADAAGRAVIPLASMGVGTLSTSLGPLAAQVRDVVLTVDLSRLEVRLIPNTSPARLEILIVDAEVGLADGTIAGSVSGVFSGDAACALGNGPRDRVALMTLRLALELGTSPRGELEVRVLPSSFDIQDFAISFETDCDKRECLDGLSPGSSSECFECETICPVADFGGAILSAVRSALDGLFDRLLDALADEVANLVLDGFLNGKPLAVEGELDLARMLGGWLSWMRTAEPVGMLARPAGQAFRVTGSGPSLGLDVILDMGVDAAAHPCTEVPAFERTFSAGPRPELEGLVVAADGTQVSYEFGLGLSDAVINQALWAIWRSGAMCVRADSGDIAAMTGAVISARTMDLMLPGVAGLAGPEAPVRISLLPRLERGPDYVQLGDVTVGGGLLVLQFVEAEVAVEVMVGDAWLRVVSFTGDMRVGLDLRPTTEDEVEVALSGVGISSLRVSDNALFRAVGLEVIAPFVVELALSFLSAQSLSFPLPVTELSGSLGIPLEVVVAAMGRAGPEGDWLALYLQLRDPIREPRRAPSAVEVREVRPGRAELFLPEAGPEEVTQVRFGRGAWSRPLVGPGPHRVSAAALWLVGTWPVAARAWDEAGRALPAEARGEVAVAQTTTAPEVLPEAPETPWAEDAVAQEEGCHGGAAALWLLPWLLVLRRGRR